MIGTNIAAVSENGVVGNNNTLIWRGLIPRDLPHFKEQTEGHTIIMGANTWKSIGSRPLPDRNHIIVSSTLDSIPYNNCTVVRTLQEAYELAKSFRRDIFFIGGYRIWKEAFELGLVDRLLLTRVHKTFEGDTVFPLEYIDPLTFVRVETEEWPEVAPKISSTLEVWMNKNS